MTRLIASAKSRNGTFAVYKLCVAASQLELRAESWPERKVCS